MSQKRVSFSLLVTGTALVLTGALGAATPLPAHAQDLEDMIDAELDEPFEFSNDVGAEFEMESESALAPASATAINDTEETLSLESDTELVDEAFDAAFDEEPLDSPAPAPLARDAEKVSEKAEAEIHEVLTFERSQEEVAPIAPPQAEEAEPFIAETESNTMDAPNVDLERRLHRIFHQSKPVSESKWSELIQSHRSEVYGVQTGDTLWDISETFFGDGMFWSKLWAENRSIENPHKIKPGKGIRFISGDESGAPQMSVVEGVFVADSGTVFLNSSPDVPYAPPIYRQEAVKLFTPEEIAEGTFVEEYEIVERPEIPPAKRRQPVLKVLPKSFVMPSEEQKNEYDSTGVDLGKRVAHTTPAAIVANSYLADAPPALVGKIEEIELSEKVAVVGQNVIVRLNRSASPGEQLTVVEVKDPIRDPVRGKVGPVVEIGGRIEILRPIEVAPKNEEGHFYHAAVTYTVNPIQVGTSLTEETMPVSDFSATGNPSQVAVRILGAEYDTNRRLFGSDTVIYLDGGANAGLRVNDLLAVQAKRGERRSDTKFPEVRRAIGLIKVIKVQNSVATALVLDAYEEIRPGDMTGGELPKPLPDLRTDVTPAVSDGGLL